MSWTSLADEVLDIVKIFDKPIDIPYPQNLIDESFITTIKSERWNQTNLKYGFSVVDVNQPANSIEGFNEFKLAINPLDLSQDEQFAINITPTQDGVVSEHNGIVFKDLVISGTTGVHSGRGVGGATSSGKGLGVSRSVSGYENFHRLRNYFRAYAKFKKVTNEVSRIAALVFINRKDNEKLIIEPIKFVLKKSSSRATLYYYNIVCRVIGTATAQTLEDNIPFFKILDDATDIINDAFIIGRGILLRGVDLLTSVEREINTTFYEPLRQTALFINSVLGTKATIGNMGDILLRQYSVKETFKTLERAEDAGVSVPEDKQKAAEKGDGQAILDISAASRIAVPFESGDFSSKINDAFDAELEEAASLSKSFFKKLKIELERIRDNAAAAFKLSSDIYNSYANRIDSFEPSSTKQTTDQEIEILFGFEKTKQALNLLIAYGGDQFEKTLEESFTEATENFDNVIDIPFPNAVDEVVIPPGSTLEDLAFVQLGDLQRWTEIAQLNNLIPPYIAETSTNKRIKQFGDKILIPSEGIPIDTNVFVGPENKFNRNLTETEKRLGIDIKLNDEFDISFNNRGDVDVIVGGANARQAITLIVRTTPGDLRLHPEFGAALTIGEKNLTPELLFDQISDSILSDPRFDRIDNFELAVDGSVIVITLNLFVTESATPVPLTFNL